MRRKRKEGTVSSEEEEKEESAHESEVESPVKPVKRKRPEEKSASAKPKLAATPSAAPKRAPAAVAADTKSRLSAFSAPESFDSQETGAGSGGAATVWGP